MALKGSCAALLLPLVLLGAWLALASGQSMLPPPPANDLFLRRHWDNPKTQASNNINYCRLLTRCRGISAQNNTFIHAPIAPINRVCARKPNGPVTSQRRFWVTDCKFQGTTVIAQYLRRRIHVICKSRVPVLLVRLVN